MGRPVATPTSAGSTSPTTSPPPSARRPRRQERHLEFRSHGPNRQSAKDAMFMEEELRGLYTSPDVARTVADYFNQDIAHGVSYLREIQFDRFADECYVELHGCRTADRTTPLDRYFDAFIVRVSEDLPCDATLIGHVDQSSPRGNDGYRHGKSRGVSGRSRGHGGPARGAAVPERVDPGRWTAAGRCVRAPGRLAAAAPASAEEAACAVVGHAASGGRAAPAGRDAAPAQRRDAAAEARGSLGSNHRWRRCGRDDDLQQPS